MVIAATVVALLAGAGGAYFVFELDALEVEAQAEEVEAENPLLLAAAATSSEFKERLYALEPFVVNVTGDGYGRYLKLKVALEAENTAVKDELDARLPQVRDALIVLLSSKRMSDITDFEGKALLKEDVLLRVNDLLEAGSVRSVMFTEFVVQ
jgi:flagellar FliL protein